MTLTKGPKLGHSNAPLNVTFQARPAAFRRRLSDGECRELVGNGPSSARRPLLPEHVIGNHAEPDEEAQRRADEKKAQVYGDRSRPASTIRLVAHA